MISIYTTDTGISLPVFISDYLLSVSKMLVRKSVRKKTTNVRHAGYDVPPVGGVTRSQQQQQAGGTDVGSQVDPAAVPLVDHPGGDKRSSLREVIRRMG